MTFERSTDYALIRGIMTHPRIWNWIGDDDAPAREEWLPVEDERFWYVIVRCEPHNELLGLFLLLPLSRVRWEIHCCLLPNAWGERAREAAREVFRWMWTQSTARRIVATIPRCNPLAVRLAERAGMRRIGIDEQSFLKYGKLQDQILLGVSPEE